MPLYQGEEGRLVASDRETIQELSLGQAGRRTRSEEPLEMIRDTAAESTL
jgi:hypothetical protein